MDLLVNGHDQIICYSSILDILQGHTQRGSQGGKGNQLSGGSVGQGGQGMSILDMLQGKEVRHQLSQSASFYKPCEVCL